MLIAPKREIAQKEWDCVGFLCDEWDYGYDPALSQMQTMLAQITAPHFVAGIVLDDGTVTTAAPIVKYMIGWNRDRVRDYCHQKAWHIRIIQQEVLLRPCGECQLKPGERCDICGKSQS